MTGATGWADYSDFRNWMRSTVVQHPGFMLARLLKHRRLTYRQAGEVLGFSAVYVNEISRGLKPISVPVAIAIGKAFDMDPYLWMNAQTLYDLWAVVQASLTVDEGPNAQEMIDARKGANNAANSNGSDGAATSGRGWADDLRTHPIFSGTGRHGRYWKRGRIAFGTCRIRN
jgi:addiction module HigA family antidote